MGRENWQWLKWWIVINNFSWSMKSEKSETSSRDVAATSHPRLGWCHHHLEEWSRIKLENSWQVRGGWAPSGHLVGTLWHLLGTWWAIWAWARQLSTMVFQGAGVQVDCSLQVISLLQILHSSAKHNWIKHYISTWKFFNIYLFFITVIKVNIPNRSCSSPAQHGTKFEKHLKVWLI